MKFNQQIDNIDIKLKQLRSNFNCEVKALNMKKKLKSDVIELTKLQKKIKLNDTNYANFLKKMSRYLQRNYYAN